MLFILPMIIPKIFYAFPRYILKAMHLLFWRNIFHVYFDLKMKVRNLLLSKKKPRVKLLVPPTHTHTQKNRRTRNRARIRRNRESKGNERMVAGERFWKDGCLAKTDKIRSFFSFIFYILPIIVPNTFYAFLQRYPQSPVFVLLWRNNFIMSLL